jgi:DNA-3-methyladenine glycosylase II
MPYRDAVAHLRAADPVMRAVVDAVGPCAFAPRAEGTHFEAVCRSIVYQQLSGKAAGTIHRRFHALYGDRAPEPRELLDTSDERLRAAGLSRQKIGYLRDLAARVASRDVPLDDVDALDDDAAIAALSRVKGVGRWTAQIFLMFRLGRPDLLPELDLGIQRGVQLAYGLPALATPKEVAAIGAPWAPWRTVASWYLWRFVDGENGGQLGD